MRFISFHRVRQLQRTLRNLRVTLICFFLTILVLRGTIGAGKFGTPAQDFEEIRHHLHQLSLHRKQARVLTEAVEERQKNAALSTAIPVEENPEEVLEGELGSQNDLKGSRITDWDEQRKAKASLHSGYGSPRILLVTSSQPSACENPTGDHYLLKSLKNKVDYCRLHGLKIFYNLANLDPGMAGFWAKLPLLQRLMVTHPDVEWLWWVDSDALITDMAFELPLENYTEFNLVLHGQNGMVYRKKTWTGLSTGSFLIRNCQWSLNLLHSWAKMGSFGKMRVEAGRILAKTSPKRPDFEADDQSALIDLLNQEEEIWADKVFLENSYYLHGNWIMLVDRYEEMMERSRNGVGDERWPFVIRFVGCKPCQQMGDYQVEICLKQMERAFNFADNQILQIYGFQHQSLASPKVNLILNDANKGLMEE